MPIEKFKLPVGRIVAGNPAIPQPKTNFKTKQTVIDPKTGQPVMEWRCKIAYSKDVFLQQIYPLLQKEALTAYPNWQQLLDQQTGMPLAHSEFSWKFDDGDSPRCPKNSKVPYNVREGYPGHFVLSISTEAFAPAIFKFENGSYRKIEANEIKCGDYVVANVDIKVHTENDGGLYFNPNGFELVGYGTAISSAAAADPTQLFGGQPVQLPPGASTTPIGAPANMVMPGMAPQVPQYQPPQYQPPQQMGVPQYQQPLPAAGHVAPQMQPGYPQGYGNAPAAPGYPSNPLPPPARDFVQNAGVPTAGLGQPMPAAPPASGFAPGATSFPTNSGIPGIPPAR